mmetsp:Transcript_17079/g.46175  ORF Transcript_17079/g.46175 Transcript_17079/m.46175 type:complete len:408 (+) Transcript_17079:196-1419(+)
MMDDVMSDRVMRHVVMDMVGGHVVVCDCHIDCIVMVMFLVDHVVLDHVMVFHDHVLVLPHHVVLDHAVLNHIVLDHDVLPHIVMMHDHVVVADRHVVRHVVVLDHIILRHHVVVAYHVVVVRHDSVVHAVVVVHHLHRVVIHCHHILVLSLDHVVLDHFVMVLHHFVLMRHNLVLHHGGGGLGHLIGDDDCLHHLRCLVMCCLLGLHLIHVRGGDERSLVEGRHGAVLVRLCEGVARRADSCSGRARSGKQVGWREGRGVVGRALAIGHLPVDARLVSRNAEEQVHFLVLEVGLEVPELEVVALHGAGGDEVGGDALRVHVHALVAQLRVHEVDDLLGLLHRGYVRLGLLGAFFEHLLVRGGGPLLFDAHVLGRDGEEARPRNQLLLLPRSRRARRARPGLLLGWCA